MGPMAQDVYAAFQLGDTDKGIVSVDADGIALAAIQGLHQVVKDQQAEIAALKGEVARLAAYERELSQLKAQVAALARTQEGTATVRIAAAK
jgi:prefoldin subunit 5